MGIPLYPKNGKTDDKKESLFALNSLMTDMG